jgi:hypothetical protein
VPLERLSPRQDWLFAAQVQLSYASCGYISTLSFDIGEMVFNFMKIGFDKSKNRCIIRNVAFENQNSDTRPHPLAQLPREDQDLIVELVLKSGSLKDLATTYSVSYPTIRARLDRVIDRLNAIVSQRRTDPMADFLATLVERGEMSSSTARVVLAAHRQQQDRERSRP